MRTQPKICIPRELFEDCLYMAKRYVAKSMAIETVILDSKTKKVLKTINYCETIKAAEKELAKQTLGKTEKPASKETKKNTRKRKP